MYEPAFIATLKNVTLVGSEPILVTSDGRTILESALNEACFLRSAGYDRIGYPDGSSELFRNLLTRQVFDEPIFPLIRLWSRGYYHWHVESLASLYSYRHYVNATALTPRLLVHADRPEWMRSSLALMGVNDDEVVEWTATYGRADTVVLASLNRAFMAPDPHALRWVSTQMRCNLLEPCSIRLNPNFYISRANALTRKVLNEEDVICALEKLGFSYYTLESLAYGDQVRLFSQASIVVGAHGAGFANLLHAECATVFELFEPSWVKSYYRNLACVLGLNYEFMMCDGQEFNLIVNVPKLMRRVEAALELQNSAQSSCTSAD
jgi:capsular polysaccharide biosynthesis protein